MLNERLQFPTVKPLWYLGDRVLAGVDRLPGQVTAVEYKFSEERWVYQVLLDKGEVSKGWLDHGLLKA